MRYLRLLLLLLLAAGPVTAQDSTEEEDKTYLENLLEGALSDASRTVTITGFRGALSSNATLQRMTIADDQGVWFTLEDASLVWSRTALLAGRLEVTELTAGNIELTRLPDTEQGLSPEDTQAKGFELPELPVSVEVETLRAERVRLGPDVLGEEALLSLDSSLRLADGDGAITLDIQRLDRDDLITLDAAYSNATERLSIDLDFEEAAGGLVSRVARIPGEPDLRLQLTGEGPLSDFEAELALSSDGQERFGGDIRIAAAGDDPAAYGFDADLSGDLRPLFTQDLHRFFGESATLRLSGRAEQDGPLTLDTLRASSGAMDIRGNLVLAADGWPERFRLEGRIGEGERLRLPVAEPAVSIERVGFTARYDTAEGDAWQAEIDLKGLARAGLKVESATLDATGTISRGAIERLTAELDFEAEGVTHEDEALAQAIGEAPQGRLRFDWQPDEPLQVGLLRVTSGDAMLTARGDIGALTEGVPVTGRAALRSADLSRFAALAGRDLDGAANATVQGTGELLGGAFEIDLAASTRDLAVGEPRLDPLLTGRSTLELSARRTEDGSFIDRLIVQNDAVQARAAGQIGMERGEMTLDAELANLSLVEPRLTGPAEISTRVGWQADGQISLPRLRVSALDAVLTADGVLDTGDPDLPVEGQLSLTANDLSRLSALTGQPLAGSADLTAKGRGEIEGRSIDAEVTLDAERFRSGIAELDRLIAGDLRLDADLALTEGRPFVERLVLEASRLSARASSAAPGAPVDISLRLADLGALATGISGPAQLQGSLTFPQDSIETVTVDLNFNGPGGTSARIGGQVRDMGRNLALSVTGNAPLGLANSFIAPRSIQGPARFDLRLDGPPQLGSLTGQISTSGARLALPQLKSSIDGLSGNVTLSGGQARVDLTGNAGAGGSFRLSGPITLAPPFDARLDIALNNLGLEDPNLYQTSLNGTVTVNGPLTGGAAIGGAVALGRTELRVPSGSSGSPGDIPDIVHLNEPADVARTRRRAGLIESGGNGTVAAFPLNLVVVAPNRIFVRGRGLDAELGGRVLLSGTTADVVASGVFELIRGRIDVLTKRLTLSEGIIDLRGSLDPYLRFVARTETDDTTVEIVLEGPASSPSVSFSSTPDLPQEEIVAQLLFGRSFTEMSAFQAAQLVSAVATLSGRGSGGLTGRLRDSLGLSDFDVTSTDSGATQFSAGAYLSENIYSEFSADSEGRNEINLNLDLSSSLTVRGSASSTGETGLGIFFEKDY